MATEQLFISDVARILGRQPQTIRRWEREGRIPPARREPITHYRVWTAAEAEEIQRLLIGEAGSAREGGGKGR